jgi:lysyl-tRNA synthetase class I
VKSKLVYPGGWVRTTLLSAEFVPVSPVCELCHRLSSGPYWFQLERRVVRCYDCQSEDELWRKGDV